MARLCLVAVMVVSGPAAAGTPEELVAHFAHTETSKVTKAHGVRLSGVRHYTELVVGTYHEGEWDHHVLILLRCTATQCHGETLWLGNHDFELHGLVDLAGAPGPIEGARVDLRHSWSTSFAGKGLRWPALVVTTRDEKVTTGGSRFRGQVRGSERHHKLLVISLRKAEAASPRVASLSTMDLYPSGAGSTVSYRLVRGKQKGALDILGVEQRHIENDSACLRPDPVEHLWRFRDGRYQQFDNLLARGCH